MFHRSRAGYYSIRGVDQHCVLEILQGKGNNGNEAYPVVYAMYRVEIKIES